MSAPLKLAAYAAALAAVFGVAAAAGGAIDPDRGAKRDAAPLPASDGHADDRDAHGAAPHEGSDAPSAGGAHGLRGLAVAEAGLRLVVTTPELRRGAREQLAFRIERPTGAVVRRFDVEHERRMHVILVRRDLTGFQHLHPTLGADGTWRTTTEIPAAGSYRVFADFSHDRVPYTLASDLRVDGPADLRDLPLPTTTATSDGGDRVTLATDDGRPRIAAGEETTLRFAISRAGAPVEVEPYLGARGHLVALREGDLGFLHVHPDGDDVAFTATFPTPGRYRLFLQYKARGRVHTVAFTVEVQR